MKNKPELIKQIKEFNLKVLYILFILVSATEGKVDAKSTETPGKMLLIKPRAFALDREELFREVPDSLENTLTDADYLILDYLMK